MNIYDSKEVTPSNFNKVNPAPVEKKNAFLKAFSSGMHQLDKATKLPNVDKLKAGNAREWVKLGVLTVTFPVGPAVLAAIHGARMLYKACKVKHTEPSESPLQSPKEQAVALIKEHGWNVEGEKTTEQLHGKLKEIINDIDNKLMPENLKNLKLLSTDSDIEQKLESRKLTSEKVMIKLKEPGENVIETKEIQDPNGIRDVDEFKMDKVIKEGIKGPNGGISDNINYFKQQLNEEPETHTQPDVEQTTTSKQKPLDSKLKPSESKVIAPDVENAINDILSEKEPISKEELLMGKAIDLLAKNETLVKLKSLEANPSLLSLITRFDFLIAAIVTEIKFKHPDSDSLKEQLKLCSIVQNELIDLRIENFKSSFDQ
ncbi:MAG: hypothetical protein H0U49_00380 [Parachlamydiaceae bacterium]|nr:hypothetical protein [Parachlamydiaceae bacterium]